MAEFAELKLPKAIEGAAAESLIGELLSLRGCPLALDAAEVDRIGGLALQILLSARAAWTADSLPFELRNLSADVRETLALCGAVSLAA